LQLLAAEQLSFVCNTERSTTTECDESELGCSGYEPHLCSRPEHWCQQVINTALHSIGYNALLLKQWLMG
jgi:hypothetical protein